jgi:DnaJ homolog subfamily A member 2
MHGMAAFEKGSGPGPGDVDINELFEHMFSGGGGGPSFGFGAGGGGFFDPSEMAGARQAQMKRRKGPDEEQDYEVSLEELYKGKTTKFASTKNVVCSHCKGTGGKEKAKTINCATCRGIGEEFSCIQRRLAC